jgi:hypothetical protein
MALPKSSWALSDTIPTDWLTEMALMAAAYPTIDISGAAGDFTLTSAHYRAPILPLSGTITGNRNVIKPGESGRLWVERNDVSGAFTVTVKTSGGSGIVVPAGGRLLVLDDGTNVVAALRANVTYTPTNVTTDRAFDCDTVAVAELADVVATLIQDLQALKIIG